MPLSVINIRLPSVPAEILKPIVRTFPIAMAALLVWFRKSDECLQNQTMNVCASPHTLSAESYSKVPTAGIPCSEWLPPTSNAAKVRYLVPTESEHWSPLLTHLHHR